MSERTKKLEIITDIFTLFEPKEKYDYIKVYPWIPCFQNGRLDHLAGVGGSVCVGGS